MKIHAYRSNVTLETAPAHLIGTTEDGRRLFQNPGNEWGPVGSNGLEVAVDYDSDGNWIELDEMENEPEGLI